MLSKPKKDCGCGGGKYNCLTKKTFAKWAKEEKKRLDCGCGCKGEKAFKKKYLIGGSILNPCPPGYRDDGLTCLQECEPGYTDDGLTCRETTPPGPGWVNDGLTFRNTNPPGPGWVNDGLTFRNTNCPDGWTNDGLTCREPISSSMDPCPDGSRDVAGTCWGKVREDCADDCFNKPAPGCNTWCAGDRDLFGNCYAWNLRTECNLRCGQSCWGVDGVTKGLAERNLRTWGGEVRSQEIRNQEIRGQRIYSKEIKGKVNFDELLKELDKGLADVFSADGALARAFDPEKNGIADAFRKFGDDMKRVLEDVGNRIKEGFEKMGESAKAAFEEFARNAERDFKQFGDDFVAKMKDPDFWVEAIGIMAMIAGAAVSILVTVGTLGIGAPAAAGIMAAAAMAGPAAKMIAAAARNEPIDALDIAAIVIAGATAVIPGMGPTVQTAMKVGTTAASFAISAVRVGQDLGMIPSTCLANCPPPPDYSPEPPLDPPLPPSDAPPPPGQKTDQEILDLAPPCTFLRVVGKPTQPAPCNSMPRETRSGPPYYTDEDWIAHYRATHYGPNATEGPTGLTSPEDQAIASMTNVNVPTQTPVILNPTEEDQLDLDVGELDLDLDLGFGVDDGLDLNLDVGELPTLDEDEVPEIDFETGDVNLELGELPEVNLELGAEPVLDLGEEPVLDLGEEPVLDLGEQAGEEALNLGEEALDLGEAEMEVIDLSDLTDKVKEKPISPTLVPKPEFVPYEKRPLEAACYAKNYPDVKSFYKIDPNNITEKNKQDLLDHWNMYGKREGRNPGCGAGRPGSLTLYYANWCHFCTKLMPIWKKLRVPGVEIRMVEEQENDELRVEGYPTIVYRKGNKMEKYSGARTKAAIEKFLKNKLK